ncbi:MAG: CvpA family protein [Gammaproteobacteria bacterium]|nr:CvpA family protein [Gammaproteobacteria bacterium]MCY4219091.1 CvpA family protein [Gammaproteobacteria bacterium]MCY4274601.1 CvpA family protein [Gammaproteobacteria bacterium]
MSTVLSIVDIAIIIIVIVSLLVGLYRGFIREFFSLVSWLLALYIAWSFAEYGAGYLESYLDQPDFRVVVSFAGIFVIVLMLLSIISHFLHNLLAFAALIGVDRYLGMLFGIARGVIIVALMIMAGTFMDFASQPWWKTSLLVSYFSPVIDLIRGLLPDNLAQLV